MDQATTTARCYYSTEKKTTTTLEEDKKEEKESTTANPLAGMMFPWERAVLSSERNEGPTPWWHKLYWFVFAFCVLLIASNRIREQFEQTNETERRELELKRNRRAMARALEGRSFVGTREYDPRTDSLGPPGEDEEEESDPFEGLEPHVCHLPGIDFRGSWTHLDLDDHLSCSYQSDGWPYSTAQHRKYSLHILPD